MGTKLKHLRNFKINVVAQFRDMWIVVIHCFGLDSFFEILHMVTNSCSILYNFGITADYNIL